MIYGSRGYPENGYLCSLHSPSLYKNVVSVLSILIRSLQKCSHCDCEDPNEGWSLGAAVESISTFGGSERKDSTF